MAVRISRNKSVIIAVMAVFFVLLLGISPQVMAFTNGEAATTVIGQSNFTSGNYNNGGGYAAPVANGLFQARDIGFDSSGDLWVADTDNNRVLEFVPGADGCGTGVLCSDMSASLVIGQMKMTANAINEGNAGFAANSSSMYYPYDIAFDSHGNLWVVDSFNNRVLEFAYPFSNGETASVVIGQSSFTASSENGGGSTSASGLSEPTALAFDSSGDLWVADRGNSRVLEYVPGSGDCASGQLCSGMSANLVIGQSSFTSSTPGYYTATGMYDPYGLAFAPNGDLWVLDSNDARVLGFVPGTSPCSADQFCTDMPASFVLGEPNLTSQSGDLCKPSTLNDTAMCGQEGIAISSTGDLWVADSYNNRVLEFVPGSSGCAADQLCTDMAASIVIGQSTFTTSGAGVSTTALNDPYGLAVDSNGNLWVSDYNNNRILEFPSSSSTSTTSTTTTTSSTTSTTTTSTTTSTSSTTSTTTTTSSTTSSTTTSTISTEIVYPSSGTNACESNVQTNVQLNAVCYTTFATFNVVTTTGAPVGGATVVISATGYQSQSGTTASTASTSALCTAVPAWTAEWGAYWGCDAGSTAPFTLEVGVTYSYTVTLASGTVVTGSIGPSTTPGTSAWTITIVTVTTPSATT